MLLINLEEELAKEIMDRYPNTDIYLDLAKDEDNNTIIGMLGIYGDIYDNKPFWDIVYEVI